MRKRSERRAHHKRMEKRTEKFECLRWLKETDQERFKENVKRMTENRKACSCFMCRNPRRNPYAKKERLTLQERRFLEKNQKEC